MTCSETQERLSRFIDGDLPPDERGAMFEHVATCSDCQRFLRESLRLQRELAHAPSSPAPDALERRVLQRLSPGKRGQRPRADVWSIRIALPLPAAVAMAIILTVGSLAIWPLILDPPTSLHATDETLQQLPNGLRTSVRLSKLLLGE